MDVLMHLLVRGAFCRQDSSASTVLSLNAPSGAGCFLTLMAIRSVPEIEGLNAPSGAGCFLTRTGYRIGHPRDCVLMHLLVLGAF